MTYRSSFQGLFQPRSVAVIGATGREGSVGRTVLANLSFGSYRGKVYAVNPGRTEVLGCRAGRVLAKFQITLIWPPW